MKKNLIVLAALLLCVSSTHAATFNEYPEVEAPSISPSDEFAVWNGGKLKNLAVLQLQKYWSLVTGSNTIDMYGNDLAAAVSVIGHNKRTLIISGAVHVSANLTIPETLAISPKMGCMIIPDSGVTVTISSLSPTGPFQWIDLSSGGSVVFGDGITTVSPDWFFDNAIPGVNDAGPAISSAIDSLNLATVTEGENNDRKSVSLSGLYYISSGVEWDGQHLEIDGPATIRVADGISAFTTIHNAAFNGHIAFKNIRFQGVDIGAGTSKATGTTAIDAKLLFNLSIENCHFEGFDDAIRLTNISGCLLKRCLFRANNIHIHAPNTDLISASTSGPSLDNITIDSCSMYNSYGSSIKVEAALLNWYIYGLDISGYGYDGSGNAIEMAALGTSYYGSVRSHHIVMDGVRVETPRSDGLYSIKFFGMNNLNPDGATWYLYADELAIRDSYLTRGLTSYYGGSLYMDMVKGG